MEHGGPPRWARHGKKNPTSAVCNSSFELDIETVGTRRIAYDFQLRPVGHNHLALIPFFLTYGSRTQFRITRIGRENRKCLLMAKNRDEFNRPNVRAILRALQGFSSNKFAKAPYDLRELVRAELGPMCASGKLLVGRAVECDSERGRWPAAFHGFGLASGGGLAPKRDDGNPAE